MAISNNELTELLDTTCSESDELLAFYKPYIDLVHIVYGYNQGDIEVYYHESIGELCINNKGRWLGYLDEQYIDELLTDVRVQEVDISHLDS